ncbi:molybdopterin-dependent oxidoreductase [Clostridium formicaceticum]|uniref:Oxidoreductase molybdopterin-binding domain-containing protein n=1 Tax=Clostridium formicaceticum TaxID=1497 RepID=A0AAC9WFF6_9CLOT|nr:molybdopterin-dependent oxidoreductase [Clostridium formicaceticum]AOY76271.1 hypothetical protein BJL90_10375 [Clostridium formicaceticum]ARE86656.1 hypothetical protein CLFO_09820 [Clostridium formicaceticum]
MKKFIPIAIAVLIIIVGISAYLNRGYVKDKQTMVENASIVLKEDDEEIDVVDLAWIEDLQPIEFKANLKSSGKDPVEHSYKGVALRKVLESKNLSLEDKQQINIRSIDGYTVALGVQEVLEEDNVYIAYERNGEPLGRKEEGGSGPYQIILRKDPFSQRWAKFVVEVELQ